jgi:predicted deacylase
MAARAPSFGVRVGGTVVGPGDARPVSVLLPGRAGQAALRDALPALVMVGRRAGPRIALLAAARGFETTAARVATDVGERLRGGDFAGCVVIVPVLRPGGRFAGAGRPVPRARQWLLPGDPAGNRAQQDAAAVMAEVVADASLVLVLSEPNPTRAGALVLRGDLDDPRTRRLALRSGAPAIVHSHAFQPKRRERGDEPAPRSDAVWLDVSVTPAGPAGAHEAAALVERLLAAEGVAAAGTGRPEVPARRPATFRRVTPVLASATGLIETAVSPGEVVAKGATLAHIRAPVTGESKVIIAPHDGMVLEGPARGGARSGAKVFVVARAKPGAARSAATTAAPPRAFAPPLAGPERVGPPEPRVTGGDTPDGPVPARPTTPAAPRAPVRVGWVERVALPQLGVKRLLAKIDTGARTSALHVARMRVVEASGTQRRPMLEIAIPQGSKKGSRAARVVRVHVREYVQIKGTSGRSERRPVIETKLRLGPMERRIRLTLTDRGDMVYPMLVGRTALGVGVLVDPSGRRLLR